MLTLLDRTDPKRIRRRILNRSSVNWRTTVAAERVSALCSALGGLDVNLRLTSEQQKSSGRCRDVGPIGRPRQRLAVGAVADPNRARVNLCLISNIAAMTAALDLHEFPPKDRAAVPSGLSQYVAVMCLVIMDRTRA